MHRLPLPLLSLLAATATTIRIATVNAAAAQRLDDRSTPFDLPLLFVRQATNDACSPQGQKVCGTDCIELTATCCPDGVGGCPASAHCQLGSNGQYGCCPNGQTCTGAGTAIITTPVSQPTNGLGLTCPAGRKLCGIGCILNSETCCPGGAGGCPLGQSCALGNNGQYGCCPSGQVCTGPGGTSVMAPATVTVTAQLNSATTGTGTAVLGSATATATGAIAGGGGTLATPTGSSSNSVSGGKKSNTGPVVGGVVGGIAVLGIIGALIFFFIVKPRSEKRNEAANAAPPPSNAYNHSSEPKPDAAVLGASVAGAAAPHHPPAHEIAAPVGSPQPQQHQQAYPSSPQWSPPPSAGYPPQPYSPQGTYPQYQQYPPQQPVGYPPQSSPPPGGAYVPQPGQQPQQFYQGYPVGSPAANARYNYPPQPQQPQQPQQPPVELPGGQR